MVVPSLSPSGSLLVLGAYVAEYFRSPTTWKSVDLMEFLNDEAASVQVPSAAVTQDNAPLSWLNIPNTVTPTTATPVESSTVAVTVGCQLPPDDADVTLSKSPMWRSVRSGAVDPADSQA